MIVVPITRSALRAHVALWHRHLPRARPGEKARFAAVKDGRWVGVVSVGRPCARAFDAARIVEVDRVATDGTRNACSALYGACRRWARQQGYLWMLTYTLQSEPGASLRAAGWVEDEHYRPRVRRTWASSGRQREARTGEVAEGKRRWWMWLPRGVWGGRCPCLDGGCAA